MYGLFFGLFGGLLSVMSINLKQCFMRVTLLLAAIGVSGCKGAAVEPPVAKLLAKPLNDTGTTFCRDSSGLEEDCFVASAQDGNQGRDAQVGLVKTGGGQAGFDWSKIATDGSTLAQQSLAWQAAGSEAANTQWRCVQDHHTGLLWEVKSDVPTAVNFRDLRYTWFDPDTTRNGGNEGLASTDDCNGIACNTAAYIAAANTQALCGTQQWRLPSVNELLSIAVSANLDYAIDTDYFPNAKNDQYWSYQSYAPNRANAWYVYFSDGGNGTALKTLDTYTRLVSGGQQ